MKIAKITLLIVSMVSLVVFLLVNQMTPNPRTTFGNGNPALMLAFILIPLFIFMVILWVRIFHVHSFGNTAFIISIFVILVHLTGAFLYQRTELIEYRHLITDALTKKEGIANAESIESITTGLSIHMNNQYFNMNTYLMYVTFSILIAIVFSIWEKKEKADFK